MMLNPHPANMLALGTSATVARLLVLLSFAVSCRCVYALLFASAAGASLALPAYRVEGYRATAEYVLEHTSSGGRVFFDGWWDGNFTYHMRHLDPTRSRSVIRGDRLLYDFVCVPSTDFHLYAANDREMLQVTVHGSGRNDGAVLLWRLASTASESH